MTADLCARCGVAAATEREWPLCEPCWQLTCDEVHLAECGLREQDERRAATTAKAAPDLLQRVMRGRVPSLRFEFGHWRGDCPWCDEDGELCESLYVYPDRYHCFACGQHGDAISFLMWSEGLGFLAAVEWLAVEAGLSPGAMR